MPAIIAKSISILSDAGLGMAMFSLGMLPFPLIDVQLSKRKMEDDCPILSVCYYVNDLFYYTGLFMALQPRIIACGNSVAAFAMAVRFLTGPAVMAAASSAIGLRGVLLHIAIVQVEYESITESVNICYNRLLGQE